MQFQVPQFIEVEDKIFGPLTVRQFIYLAGGAGFAAIMITLLPFYIAVIISLPVVLLAAALAFYKVNNRSFIELLQSIFSFYTSNNLYIWKPREPKFEPEELGESALKKEALYVPKPSQSRLKDLAWSLDIKESSIYSDRKQR